VAYISPKRSLALSVELVVQRLIQHNQLKSWSDELPNHCIPSAVPGEAVYIGIIAAENTFRLMLCGNWLGGLT
jgi:hypothetical protein